MKNIVFALLMMTGASAFASAPHCPAGQNNVWGACLDQGGILNPYLPAYGSYHKTHGHKRYYTAPTSSHCPAGQNNVWGACLDKGAGVFNPWFN